MFHIVVTNRCRMPVIDGVTCTKQIRAMEVDGQITGSVAILGVTANARPDQIKPALEAGMNDVITKPFTVKELMNRINSFIDSDSDVTT